MKFPWRGNPAPTAGGPAAWCGPPPLAERGCCCPARPVVRALIPPARKRRLPADLLLCGHHYLASKAALAAVGAVVIDETGAVLYPPAAFGSAAYADSDPLFDLPDPQASSIVVLP